ncbi:MAG: hypothetical protein ACREJX_02065, partial [Polyangiaceae bacterium]
VPLNFDELAAEADVTSQYAAHVTFSSPSEPIHVEGSSVDFGSSPPNFLCSSSCVDDYDLDFAAPVKGVHFSAVGANDTGTIAKVNVYVSGSLAQTVDIIGQGDTAIPVAVDLSSFSNVTRIEVTNITDEGGIGIDDLSFDFPNAS